MKLKADQLKDLIRKEARNDSTRSQILFRNYIMERFLERIAVSKYKNNFILKGGLLVASIVGLNTRATLDIDTTVKYLPLSIITARKFVSEIIAIPINDGVIFTIKDVTTIMDEADYSGVRVSLAAQLENIRTPLKVDISTGDAITPKEVFYDFKLMFENRNIAILAYNLETVLAEKLETILSRGTANTRLRDFYDIYILQNNPSNSINLKTLKDAFGKTVAKRTSISLLSDTNTILNEIESSKDMQKLWKTYQKKFDYATDITWTIIINSVKDLFNVINDN